MLHQAGRRISVARKPGTAVEKVFLYLLGPVMGLVLRLRGLLCLHASAVVIMDQAIAFMAPPGYGKSTLATAFAKMGHPVLTDDKLVLVVEETQLKVLPSYPLIRLLPEAIEPLFGNDCRLPKRLSKNPNLAKYVLDLTDPDYRFADTLAPLHAVYTGIENPRLKKTRVKAIRGTARFLALSGNTYFPQVIPKNMHRTHFKILERVAERVPVRRIETPSRNAMTPFELRDFILDDFNRLSQGEADRPLLRYPT